jgi:hypothetical protein
MKQKLCPNNAHALSARHFVLSLENLEAFNENTVSGLNGYALDFLFSDCLFFFVF